MKRVKIKPDKRHWLPFKNETILDEIRQLSLITNEGKCLFFFCFSNIKKKREDCFLVGKTIKLKRIS